MAAGWTCLFSGMPCLAQGERLLADGLTTRVLLSRLKSSLVGRCGGGRGRGETVAGRTGSSRVDVRPSGRIMQESFGREEKEWFCAMMATPAGTVQHIHVGDYVVQERGKRCEMCMRGQGTRAEERTTHKMYLDGIEIVGLVRLIFAGTGREGWRQATR
ncbi:hypothetical protein HDK77DRAFT_108670 [Phyllosticta capitalensis]